LILRRADVCHRFPHRADPREPRRLLHVRAPVRRYHGTTARVLRVRMGHGPADAGELSTQPLHDGDLQRFFSLNHRPPSLHRYAPWRCQSAAEAMDAGESACRGAARRVGSCGRATVLVAGCCVCMLITVRQKDECACACCMCMCMWRGGCMPVTEGSTQPRYAWHIGQCDPRITSLCARAVGRRRPCVGRADGGKVSLSSVRRVTCVSVRRPGRETERRPSRARRALFRRAPVCAVWLCRCFTALFTALQVVALFYVSQHSGGFGYSFGVLRRAISTEARDPDPRGSTAPRGPIEFPRTSDETAFVLVYRTILFSGDASHIAHTTTSAVL
jgi:hypothetical protein